MTCWGKHERHDTNKLVILSWMSEGRLYFKRASKNKKIGGKQMRKRKLNKKNKGKLSSLKTDYFSLSWSSWSADRLWVKPDVAVHMSACCKSLQRNPSEFISQLLRSWWNKWKIKRIVLPLCRRLILRLFRWNLTDLTHQSVFSTMEPSANRMCIKGWIMPNGFCSDRMHFKSVAHRLAAPFPSSTWTPDWFDFNVSANSFVGISR